MAPAWASRLRELLRPPLRTPPVAPPGPDPEHEAHLEEARQQSVVAEEQLSEARQIARPLAETARRLKAAGGKNHFSEQIEEMIKRGYGPPRGEHH